MALQEQLIVDKTHKLYEPVIGEARTAKAIDPVLNLAELPSIQPIAKTMRPEA